VVRLGVAEQQEQGAKEIGLGLKVGTLIGPGGLGDSSTPCTNTFFGSRRRSPLQASSALQESEKASGHVASMLLALSLPAGAPLPSCCRPLMLPFVPPLMPPLVPFVVFTSLAFLGRGGSRK
jgi:hypothetical protein